jgi:hypothetical protein
MRIRASLTFPVGTAVGFRARKGKNRDDHHPSAGMTRIRLWGSPRRAKSIAPAASQLLAEALPGHHNGSAAGPAPSSAATGARVENGAA